MDVNSGFTLTALGDVKHSDCRLNWQGRIYYCALLTEAGKVQTRLSATLSIGKVLFGRRIKKPAGNSDTLNAVEVHLSEFHITYTVGANFCSIITLCG